MWFHGEHTLVEPHRLLAYTEQVTDEAGAPVHGDLTEVRVGSTKRTVGPGWS